MLLNAIYTSEKENIVEKTGLMWMLVQHNFNFLLILENDEERASVAMLWSFADDETMWIIAYVIVFTAVNVHASKLGWHFFKEFLLAP